MPKRSSKPRDLNQLAKAIVDEATGNTPKLEPRSPESEAAALLGRKGGLKGGRARAESLSKSQRSAIAKKAALSRWKKGRA
jgi:hypothetical protein